ncbi:MAG: hypothetical protein LUQ13_01710 [Methanomicrobiales archaeon]|nr:hypothetical protein [Methanomicrobiales archaeon]
MTCSAGLLWDHHQIFHRYVEDCGIRCDVVTPHLLAAPFFRSRFVAMIVPTGFGNPSYSRLFPALGASAERIERYVEDGGNLLVYGAATARTDAYAWLPFPVTYVHGISTESVTTDPCSSASAILEGCDCGCVTTDGFFTRYDATPRIWNSCGTPVLLEYRYGKGSIVVTSIHEYPSRKFLSGFCCSGRETLF